MSWQATRYCRWCGKAYKPKKDIGRDGFCCIEHKQAHYRAYKKYVTQKEIREQLIEAKSNARKKRKKKKT